MNTKYIARIIRRVDKALLRKEFNYFLKVNRINIVDIEQSFNQIIGYGIAQKYPDHKEPEYNFLSNDLLKVYNEASFNKTLSKKIDAAASGSRISQSNNIFTVNHLNDAAAFEPSQSLEIRKEQELKYKLIS